jgi:mono/diheme cytochrome c family protein
VTTTVAVAVLALVGLGIIVFLVVNANRGRRRLEDVPPGLRPAYSDEELEGRVLETYMLWGAIMVMGLALFFPIYWLVEESRINRAQGEFLVESYVLGEQEYGELCAACHGPAGEGGIAPVAGDPQGWPAPNLTNIVARYQDSNVVDVRRIREFIWRTIEQGRPGTPMPAWGAAFDGPLQDQGIEAIVDWILLNQVDEPVAEADPARNLSGEELYQQNCAKCHGAELQGEVGPPLIGLFARHSEGTVLEILRNGIKVPTGAIMPPWQSGYMYEDARFTDDALERIVAYLAEQQPEDAEPHDGTIAPRPEPAQETESDEQPADA